MTIYGTIKQLRNLTCLRLQWSFSLVNEDCPISTNSFYLISQNDVDFNRILIFVKKIESKVGGTNKLVISEDRPLSRSVSVIVRFVGYSISY